MKIKEIMTANPMTITKSATILDALESMERHQCRYLPVVDAHYYPVGMISHDRCSVALQLPSLDELLPAIRQRASTIEVSYVMHSPVIVEPQARTAEAARLLYVKNVSSLIVMEGNLLVGIVTQSDLIRAMLRMLNKVNLSVVV